MYVKYRPFRAFINGSWLNYCCTAAPPSSIFKLKGSFFFHVKVYNEGCLDKSWAGGFIDDQSVILPSFLVGQEVRSHQRVQESPAVGQREDKIIKGDWQFIIFNSHICIMIDFDIQILLVHHLLPSLPWHRLDPVGRAEQGYWRQPCSHIQHSLSTEYISTMVYKWDADVYS